LDISISDDQMHALLTSALRTEHPVLLGMHPLAKLQFCAIFTKAFVTLNRGGELRDLTFGMCFLRTLEAIGGSGGAECGHFVSNKAKKNQVGNFVYKAFACHVNPLQDVAAWDGLCFAQRFATEGEPFPSFTDWQSFNGRALYRSIRSHLQALSAATMHSQWRAIFDAHGVVCDKLTHQPRKQGQQFLDSFGVGPSQIGRMADHLPSNTNDRPGLTKVQHQSYLTTPPIEAVVVAAGGKRQFPECHHPGWANVNGATRALLTTLMNALNPLFRSTLDDIAQQSRNCPSYQEKKARRLFAALGSIEYMNFALERALLMLASKPMKKVCGVWKLQVDSPVILDLCDRTNRNSIFSSQVFDSLEFEQLKVEVAQSQAMDDQNLTHMPGAQQAAIVQNVANIMIPHLARVENFLSEQRGESAANSQRLNAVEAQLATLVGLVNLVISGGGGGIGGGNPVAPQVAPAAPNPPVAAAPPVVQPLAPPVLAPAAQQAAARGARSRDNNHSVREYWAAYTIGQPPIGPLKRVSIDIGVNVASHTSYCSSCLRRSRVAFAPSPALWPTRCKVMRGPLCDPSSPKNVASAQKSKTVQSMTAKPKFRNELVAQVVCRSMKRNLATNKHQGI
jgi:hypothetical protein